MEKSVGALTALAVCLLTLSPAPSIAQNYDSISARPMYPRDEDAEFTPSAQHFPRR